VSELAQGSFQVRILVLFFFILFPQRISTIIEEACDSGFYCRTSGLDLW
jgi:hypothetical protein